MPNLYSAYRWIPGVYLMQGISFALVTVVSAVIYKNFNFNNTQIALYTSLFATPWLLKPLMSPLLETVFLKRQLILKMQFLIAGLIFLLAWSLSFLNFLLSACIFIGIAFAGAIYDINSDGMYIVALSKQAQAHFVGVRAIFYQIGKLICQGALVFIAGLLLAYFEKTRAWQIALALLAIMIFMLAIYHQHALPKVEKIATQTKLNLKIFIGSFKKVFQELVNLPHLGAAIAFTLGYNLSEAQLIKIIPLFFLDTIQDGGLELSISSVGILYGGVNIIGMLIGILLSGFLLTKFSLKKYIIPVTLFAGLTNLGYLLLSLHVFNHVFMIGLVIFLAQFGFGLCNGAYMLCLLNIFAKGSYPMSLYAVGTTLMVFSMIFGGAISGYLQSLLGYTGFFIWIGIGSFSISLLLTGYNIRNY